MRKTRRIAGKVIVCEINDKQDTVTIVSLKGRPTLYDLQTAFNGHVWVKLDATFNPSRPVEVGEEFSYSPQPVE